MESRMTDDLLPCPFCGLPPDKSYNHAQMERFYVWCYGPKDNPHGQIAAWSDWWNTRAPTPAPT